MNSLDYNFLTTFVREKSGLALGAGREYFLEGRLVPLARKLGIADLGELVAELKSGRNPQLSTAIVEAMTINETSFFRDQSMFEDLKLRIIPSLIAARAQSHALRIWCAATASGQEPYSVLMTLDETFPQFKDWMIDFVATDIAAEVLTRAEAGVYSPLEAQRGLPMQMLMKYFEPCSAGWQVKGCLRKRIKFRKLNLLDNFQHLGPFDVIFCRNVLIYFEVESQAQVLRRLSSSLRNDGFLLLGATETMEGISDRFLREQSCTSSVYLPALSVPS